MVVRGRKEEESGKEKVWSESEKKQGVTGALKVMCVCVFLTQLFIHLAPSVSTYLMTGWNGCTTPVNTAALLSQSPMTTLNYTLYSCHTW